MVKETNPVMEIKHTNGTKDRVDEEVDGVSRPMLNLPVNGKFQYRIKALAAIRTQSIDEERRGDKGRQERQN